MEQKTKEVYFIGIGGIGMSALAQYFKDQGMAVTGSDREASPVTELLEKKGIKVIVGQKKENVPQNADVVVYSDAVPEDNLERAQVREFGIPQFSYFAMLGKVSEGKKTIAVAGTKGKTTTVSMLTKILKDADVSPTAVIGSLVKDFGSNYVHGNSDLFIVEACEYRNHLLELSPHVLVITNLEWDHTDWFPSLVAVQETFRKAVMCVPKNGAVITDPNNKNIAPLLSVAKAHVIDYTKEPAYTLRMLGEFNQSNARAAIAAARAVLPSISDSVISKSLATFHGIWRRFEYKGKSGNGADVYDDYAHNPMSVRAILKALRAQVKGKVFVAFHPHLYSRTRDLLDEFATAFVDADKVFVAPIYAARESDDGTISSEMLAERIRATGVDATALDSFDAIERALGAVERGDVIMTMGAGDIYKVADALVRRGK
ncbi:MAG: Mur ligase domain-containing protein [Minisyncoccia bacterium]|jgi:UDP-N-acetylmuramate--alanine ligase